MYSCYIWGRSHHRSASNPAGVMETVTPREELSTQGLWPCLSEELVITSGEASHEDYSKVPGTVLH